MTKERKQFEEHFALTVMDPGSWLEQAQGMRVAAKPVLENLLGILHEPQTRAGVRLQKLAYVRGYMLLTGFAFENLLRAIAAKRGLLGTTRSKLTFAKSLSQKSTKGHGLTELARELKLGLTSAEEHYLKRLEAYTLWAGRYPVPMNSDEYGGSHSDGRLSFATSDPRMGDALFDKLSETVESSA